MRYFLLFLIALSVNAQSFSLRDPAFLGALKPKAVVTPPASNGLLNGLLAYWKADEASGDMADSSGNHNTMIALSTNITYKLTGIINSCVGYTGSGANKMQTAVSVLPSNDFTLSLWFQLTNSSTTSRMYDTEDAHGTGMALAVNWPTQAGQVGVYMSGTTPGVYGSATVGLNDGAWHHVAVIYASLNLSIYIDGLLDTNFGNIGEYSVGVEGDALSGAAGNSFSSGIVGKLDELGVWNRALNSAEIADIAAATPYGSFTN